MGRVPQNETGVIKYSTNVINIHTHRSNVILFRSCSDRETHTQSIALSGPLSLVQVLYGVSIDSSKAIRLPLERVSK